MFGESFKITALAVIQIFIPAVIGYFLVKRNVLNREGLRTLSKLLIGVTLPLLIFCQLTRNFTFSLYPYWWGFPLISVAITLVGLAAAFPFQGFIKEPQGKQQFLSLAAFQNSGYLPLALAGAVVPQEKIGTLFIYIFLFLLGFNLVIWSLGVYLLTFSRTKKFALGSLFSPPVIATVFSLLFIFLRLNKFIPQSILRPLQMVGDCTLPLAMFVVGGSLAEIKIERIEKAALSLVLALKLVLLPVLGLIFILLFKIEGLLGLLILMQLAMPSATTLSLIIQHYHKEDIIISQGIFFSHIFSLLTIPLFLTLYFMLAPIK